MIQTDRHYCGNCDKFPICSKINVKNAKRTTEYCLWEVDYFRETL